MNTRVMTIAAAGALVCAAAAAPAGQQASPDLDKLAWLAGCWTSTDAARQVDEQWMKPLGGTMMGMSRTVVGGKTVDSEAVVIRQTGSAVDYVAKPARQSEASFRMVSLTATEVRFENLQHDFPQRIIYRLNPDGSLHARVEGTRDGKVRGIDFPMMRGSC
jgi:hypothetical protein